jgi:chromosome condensin MukBEF complex kleisin-like MukF subunit
MIQLHQTLNTDPVFPLISGKNTNKAKVKFLCNLIYQVQSKIDRIVQLGQGNKELQVANKLVKFKNLSKLVLLA